MFNRVLRDCGAGVSIIAALLIFVLIGISGLALEFGHGLLTRVQDQHIADFAAYAGAVTYNASGSTTTASATAARVAALNGVAGSSASLSIVNSPTGDGNQAAQATISTSDQLMLSRVLGTGSTLPVSATAYAELGPGSPGCIIALNHAGTGITLTGGTSVTAAGCTVASNNTVSVPCGTTITTKAVDYNSSSAPSEPCNGIQPPSGTGSVRIAKTPTTDPLSGVSAVTTATARLATVSAMTSPSGPTVTGGTSITFGYSQSTTQSQLAADGCSGTFSGSTWTVTCSGGSAFTFGSISLSGGITVNFNTGGAANITYNFNGQISNTGTALTFGPGTYNVTQGITTGGGTTTTFGAGTFNIGRSTSGCSGGGKYSICNTGTTLTFGGPSSFVLAAGIYNKGGSTLTLGSGSTNSFNIGASSDGNSLYMGGGAITTFADATGAGDLFQMAGNLNVASGGGSCLAISAASQHDIDGYMSTAGGTLLGAGVYTVAGYVALGNNGGGDVTCNGATLGMNATGVTFVIGGGSTPSSGTCANQAFCVAAGYGHVTLTAPTSGNTEDLAVIGPTSGSNTAGATFAEGASNTSISGAFYLPNGAVSLSGAATVGNGPGQCLELIGSQVTLNGGSAVGTTCAGLNGSGSANATVSLVQ